MSVCSIRETCSCGATIEITGQSLSVIGCSAAEWRRGHEHHPPHLPEPSSPPPGPDKPTPVEGTHHDSPDTPTSLGFTPPSTDWERWGDR